ncbi:MAG: glycoside hydrolase family 3 C-terminal domain-containing protein [Candidatus Dadabacteria bacterium]|nr:glycoside hydrolase family 3 C-terminal domain-containing protein [Candidatus Dadabacteria bacterium]
MFKSDWVRFLGIFALFLVISLGTLGGCENDGGGGTDDFLCRNVSEKLINPGNKLDFSNLWSVVDEFVNRMTLDEKLGQMILADLTFLKGESGKTDFSLINEFHLGGILIDANVVPDGKGDISTDFIDEDLYLNGTMKNWQELSGKIIETARNGNQIPLLIGTDNIHGNQHVVGEILVPHNIGLAATHDPEIICATAFFNSFSVLESGLNWGYSPTVAVSHNFQWGRAYETLGSVPEDIVEYSKNYVFGHQAIDFDRGIIRGILATTKHLVGDGATFDGIDEGNVHVNNLNNFLNVNLLGFLGGIEASVGSTMVSYSGINTMPPFNIDDSVPMSINSTLLQSYLNGDFLGSSFNGFLLSDFNGIEKAANQGLPTTGTKIPFEDALTTAINGGIHMIMTDGKQVGIPDLGTYIGVLKKLVENDKIPIEEIDDAVRRILAVKFAMGLIRKENDDFVFQYEKGVEELPDFNRILPRVSGASDTKDAAFKTALIAARESLVLLKNEGLSNDPDGIELKHTLPIDFNKIQNIVLVGEKIIDVQTSQSPQPTLFQDYDNIGAQNGGWTVRWQGFEGNKFWQGENRAASRAGSILDGLNEAIKDSNQDIQLLFPQYTSSTDLVDIATVREEFLNFLSELGLTGENTVIIGVLSEVPYAEFMGDINNPACKNNIDDFTNGCLYNLIQFKLNTYLPRQQIDTLEINFGEFDRMVIDLVKNQDPDIPLVTILFSGRPMIISSAENDIAPAPLDESNAFIAAWLPGTAGGEAIVDALLGSYLFCKESFTEINGQKICNDGSPNTLPVDWLRNMDQLQNYPVYETNVQGFPRIPDPLFEIGFGLATTVD